MVNKNDHKKSEKNSAAGYHNNKPTKKAWSSRLIAYN